MRPTKRSIYLSLLLLFIACGVGQTAEELWRSSEGQVRARKYRKAIRTLEKLVATYPEHALAPKALFQTGDIFMNNMDDLQSSVTAYQETTILYPDTDEGVKALFMVGFVYANHLKDYEAARQAYTGFMDQYPNHELIPSVKFELENLGKSADEIEALKGVTNAI
ncbi:MAG: tetratricopeptide repeat protein [Fidelibacterota bacterium]|nr:MAG: tetratricopeptide repeat protein [Candidatus Neomarinimicrobiota bacterium]